MIIFFALRVHSIPFCTILEALVHCRYQPEGCLTESIHIAWEMRASE